MKIINIFILFHTYFISLLHIMNEKEKSKYISITQAHYITGLSVQSLRKLGDDEKIKCFKTPSGHRRFDKQDLEKFCNSSLSCKEVSITVKQNYIYARVSSKKQMDDLSRQIEFIQSCRPEYSSYTVISDIASGINFNRKGLQTLLDACVQKTIGEVVVAHRDRLCRFGFDLARQFITKCGGQITILDDNTNKSSQQELAEHLLSIIHIYSCRQMGRRSYSKPIKSTNSTPETIQTAV